jgi:DNA-binding Lrp family transcriptional regulator
MRELTKKDRKLLYCLHNSGEESLTKIAKLVGISKDTAANKIANYLRMGIIIKFTADIKSAVLGNTFTVLLKFNQDIYKNPEIINYFKNHPFSIWVTTLSGNYDIIAEFLIQNMFQIEETIIEIREHFGDTLNKYDIDLFAKQLRLNHFLEDLSTDFKIKLSSKETNPLKKKTLDDLDRKILHALAIDSNKSYIKLAGQLKSTWDVVRYRIKQLRNHGYLLNTFPEINYKKIGYQQFICKISLQNISSNDFQSLESLITKNKNITYAFTSATSFSVIFNCAYRSLNDLDDFLRKIQERFKGRILASDYYIQREQVKFNLFPDGLLKSS